MLHTHDRRKDTVRPPFRTRASDVATHTRTHTHIHPHPPPTPTHTHVARAAHNYVYLRDKERVGVSGSLCARAMHGTHAHIAALLSKRLVCSEDRRSFTRQHRAQESNATHASCAPSHTCCRVGHHHDGGEEDRQAQEGRDAEVRFYDPFHANDSVYRTVRHRPRLLLLVALF